MPSYRWSYNASLCFSIEAEDEVKAKEIAVEALKNSFMVDGISLDDEGAMEDVRLYIHPETGELPELEDIEYISGDTDEDDESVHDGRLS